MIRCVMGCEGVWSELMRMGLALTCVSFENVLCWRGLFVHCLVGLGMGCDFVWRGCKVSADFAVVVYWS